MEKLAKQIGNLKINECVLEKGISGQRISVNTNAIELQLKSNLPVFKFDVRFYEVFTTTSGEEKRKELCKQTQDDFTEIERKTKAVLLIRYLSGKDLPSLTDLAYDRAASLFSLKKFKDITKRLPKASLSSIEGYVFDDKITGVDVEIKHVTETFQASTNDLTADKKTELLEYLNLLSSQVGFNKPKDFVVFGNSRFFPLNPEALSLNTEPELNNGMLIGIGCVKSVRIADGNKPIIVLDVTKTAFHYDDQPLIAKLESCVGRNLAEALRQKVHLDAAIKLISGLIVYSTHLGRRVEYKVKGFGKPAGVEAFEFDGVQKTVVQYFHDKYSKNVNKNLPVIRTTRIVMPMDLLFVASNQRASKLAVQGKNLSTLIKASATKPSIRQAQTSKLSQALKLNGTAKNEFFNAAGVNIAKGPMQIPARVLPLPNLVIAGKQSNQSRFDFKQPIMVSGALKSWAVYLTPGNNDPSQYREMVQCIQKGAPGKGLKLPAPVEIVVFKGVNIEECFKKEKARSTQFMLFITCPSVSIHAEIKLLERKYNILTQEIKGDTKLRGETLSNILQKLNTKIGGITWGLPVHSVMLSENLIIGIEFTHPSPSFDMPTEPSVLGWSANILTQSQSFGGSFSFIQPRMADNIANIEASLKKIVAFAVDRFTKLRAKAPKKVIVYRNGASEGHYGTILREEIGIVSEAIKAANKDSPIPLIYIAVAKTHNHRFYSSTGENLACGTVIDTAVVASQTNEFFLNGHIAIKGTAKAPKYTIIFNGPDGKLMSMDQIQQLTLNLQYLHQICAATPSLPVVLRVASECAKRGASNYRQMFGFEVTEEKIDIANTRLDYIGSGLINIRYNA